MNCRTLSVWVALVAFLCGGCGTKYNLFPKTSDEPHKVPRVYGGVREDLAVLADLDLRGSGEWLGVELLAAALALIDLPLSFVGDTLTLPYVALHALFGPRPAPLKQTERSTPYHRVPEHSDSEKYVYGAEGLLNRNRSFQPANSPSP